MLPAMRPRAILGAILLGALALRLIAIGDTLSNDEGYTWLVASAHGPGALIDRLGDYENTPPLYYLLTWPLPSSGVAWLRIVSVLAGVGCVAAVWWVARGRAGLYAAAAVAVAPFAVSYADYARGFVLADLGLLIALGAAMRGRWWLYALGAVIALYAEYDSALFLIALTPVVGWRALPPLLVLIPWLPAIHSSPTKVSPVYPDPGPGSLRDTIVRLTFGEHGTAHAPGLRWLQFAIVAAVLVVLVRRAPRIVWVTALGTLVLHAVVHLVGPDIFAPRYLTELIPLGALAFGYWVAAMPRAVGVGAAVALAALGIGVAIKRAGGNNEPDYRAIAAVIAPAARGRAVLTNSAVVAYYLRSLHPALDRPFGLGAGLESRCSPRCLIVDDVRVAGGARPGPGAPRAFGPIVVRATRK